MSTRDWMTVLDELSGTLDGVEALNRLLQAVRDEAYDDGYRDGTRAAGMQERTRLLQAVRDEAYDDGYRDGTRAAGTQEQTRRTEDTSDEPRTVAVRVASLVGSDGAEVPVWDETGDTVSDDRDGDGAPSVVDVAMEMLL